MVYFSIALFILNQAKEVYMLEGISVSVLSSTRQEIAIEFAGYLGRHIEPLTLMVEVGRERPHLTAFTLDGTHCVHSKRNDAKDSTSDVIGRYRLSIPVTRTPTEGIYVTMPATNNLRLLDAPDGGCATLGEICVISQRGEFFLVVQNEAISCRQDDGGRVICLGLDGRPQIAEYLASLYANRKESLPPLQPPLPDPPVETFLVNHGRVLWWSASQGMGRILTNKGVVGVHWSNVAPSDRRAYLVPGEPVSYVTLRTPHDSGRKKSYQWEAIGVLHLVVE